MPIIARQSTARTVTVGPVLDADGVAVTTAVVGNFKISKNGGAPAALNGSATLTHRNTGHYSLALTTSDLDTVGSAEVVIDATTNACPPKTITVIEEEVYDDLFAASAPGYLKPSVAGRTLGVESDGDLTKVNTLDGLGATAVARLAAMFGAARLITVDDATFSPTTTVFETDQTTDASAYYTEQVLYGATGNNAGHTTRITGYAYANSKVKLTVDTLVAAPADGDTFLLFGRIEQS